MKIIDIDKLFDDYISKYVYENIGKVKPEEIEDQMPVLYEQFGDTPLAELQGKTPNTFYKEIPAVELLDLLEEHITSGVGVSDFLCEAITSADGVEQAVCKKLSQDNDEEFTLYLMNFLNDLGSDKATARYLEFIMFDYSEPIRELATELLNNFADKEKEAIIEHYKDASAIKRACLTEVLSHASKDERVFNILINEFIANPDNMPLYAGYLAKYGDDRALPFLYTAIENEKISYMDFEELRFDIEVLGGEYTKKRDFSKDKSYKKIKESTIKKPKII